MCMCAHTCIYSACAHMYTCHAGLILLTSVSVFQLPLQSSLQSSALALRLDDATFCYLMQGGLGIFWLMAGPFSGR